MQKHILKLCKLTVVVVGIPLARRKSYGQTVRSNEDESEREVIKDEYDVKDKIEMHAC